MRDVGWRANSLPGAWGMIEMTIGSKTRWSLLLIGETVLTVIVLATFWLQDWRYSLPTPRPANLRQPAPNELIQLPESVSSRLESAHGTATSNQPILIHFFNPACPCSRFNSSHIRELVSQFTGQARIVAVLENSGSANVWDSFLSLQLNCPAVVDHDGAIAASVGVYSTPQAVVLDSEGRLYFRGNYNAGRYCVNRETEFARLALEACLKDQPLPEFPAAATIAQGCPLSVERLLQSWEQAR